MQNSIKMYLPWSILNSAGPWQKITGGELIMDAAGHVFIFGNKLKQKGIYNGIPLLDNTELAVEIDFREIYTTILNNWFKTDATKILGKKYSSMNWV